MSKNLSMDLKRGKNTVTDDIFTHRNIDAVTQFLKEQESLASKQFAKLRATEFPTNHDWFNCEPISFEKDCKGKITVLDFWTYCCINCLHVLPDLEYLENKFKGESSIVFIGCHSAKFKNEKSSDKVRDAVLKYSIKHPVINDDKMLVWRSFERHSWPSIVVLSPKLIPILVMTGEGHR